LNLSCQITPKTNKHLRPKAFWFLILTFFNGLGGMVIIAALVGIWDMISGLALAFGLI